jgi:hypothetical protein
MTARRTPLVTRFADAVPAGRARRLAYGPGMAMTSDDSARVVIDGGSFAERFVCHPRSPLIAGLDSARPAVHVWEFEAAGLRELDVVDADAAEYPPEAWNRLDRIPSVAWHPHDPRLLVTGGAGLRQWAPDGMSVVDGLPSGAAYRNVAFSPDGSTVWAAPSSSGDEDTTWETSDAFDLARGALRSGGRWDTGVVEHPGGGLVVTLASDQGATLAFFARPDDSVPACMRVFRHALILDVDGYEAPVFSADGRFLAIRGNAYVHSLDVFEFPTLRKVLHTTLGDPYPGYPYPPEWLEEQALWSHHNIAFARRSGSLLVGTPQGSMIEIDLDGGRVVEHSVCGAPVSALAVLSTGQLVIADRTGQVTVMAAPEHKHPSSGVAGQEAARDRVEAFLATTTELPDDADLDTDLVCTDGVRTWDSDDLDSVTTADDADPTWLRLQVAINASRDTRT